MILIGIGTLALAVQVAPGNVLGFLFGGIGLALLALGGLGITLLLGPFRGVTGDLQGSLFLLAFGASQG